MVQKVAVTYFSQERELSVFCDPCILLIFVSLDHGLREILSDVGILICLCPTGEPGLDFSTRSVPRCQELPFFFLSLHGQDTHLFLCPAISASPWLQKVDVTVESVVGKGF